MRRALLITLGVGLAAGGAALAQGQSNQDAYQLPEPSVSSAQVLRLPRDSSCVHITRATVRFLPPPGLARLSPPKQLEYLRSHATDLHGKLLYGVALQRLGRQLSAQREFEAAARLAPGDPEPQVAVAVGRFDKADPSRTFSRLGPLAKRYPRSQSVRFHLGLSLLWLGSVKKAKEELRLARDAGSTTPLGTEARRFLERLKGVGTG